jgi:alkylation response protein AidB-like acyl-CoA dehydrogenase
MTVRHETARLLVYRAAWLKQRNCPAGSEAAMTKLFLNEEWVQPSLDAVQIHGGYRYTTE